MNPHYAKTLNRIVEIENFVLKGLVLNDTGNWVPISEKIAVEQDFTDHLARGQVIHDGAWMDIAEARNAPAKTRIKSPVVPPYQQKDPLQSLPPQKNESYRVQSSASESEETLLDFPPETKVLSRQYDEQQNALKASPPGRYQENSVIYPEETKRIVFEHPQKNRTAASQDIPDPSYPPETAYLGLEATGEGTPNASLGESVYQAQRSEVEKETQAQRIPQSSEWEKSAKQGHQKALLIGGSIIILAGLAALYTIFSPYLPLP